MGKQHIDPIDISAAGRTLSAKNAERLKTAWTEIGFVLIDAGVVNQQEIEDLEKAEESSAVLPIEASQDSDLIKAGSSFVRDVKLQNWLGELRTTLRLFGDRYEMLHAAGDDFLAKRLGEDIDRHASAQETLDDLITLLTALSDKHPGPSDSSGYYSPPDYYSMSAKDENVQAGALIQDVKQASWHGRLETILRIFAQQYARLHLSSDADLARLVGAGVTRDQAIAQMRDDLVSLVQDLGDDHPGPRGDGYYSGGYFSLSKSEKASEPEFEEAESGQTSIAIQCAAMPVQSASGVAANRREFEGVLFRIDEPSENAPSVGPGLPLYVPRAVAESALHCCTGLPLDADASLSKHANDDIAGVIMSARIEGDDFIVKGYLYDWSRSDRIDSISANKNNLGMSMNAAAAGHETTIGDQKVYWIDSLQLLGANILFADKATYQRTRVLSAGGCDDESDIDDSEFEIAAATVQQELSGELNQASQAISRMNADLSRLVSQLNTLSLV